MIKNIIPDKLYSLISDFVNINNVYEIRLRNNMPIMLNVLGRYLFLETSEGVISNVIADTNLINYVLSKATSSSLYAYNNQIINGFITTTNGLRIGICGEVVTNESTGEIKTITNISSLVIRIPHEIKNCALKAFTHMETKYSILNTLIIAPPGAGKTTFLRDISRLISQSKCNFNTLIIDERFEIAGSVNGQLSMNIGSKTDVISGCSKEFGFREGIRSSRPDIILTDEIANESDVSAVINAINSGVKVIASAHGFSHLDLFERQGLKILMNSKFFDRYVVLSSRQGNGTYEGIFDENFNPLGLV